MRHGHIDAVHPGGIVDGWCWDDEAPDEAIDVTILVDGLESGRAIAGLYREDLRASKIGDGFHAFTLALTEYDPGSRRVKTLVLTQTGSRTPIGHPFLLRHEIAQSLDDRLIELEARNRLLESKVRELQNHALQGGASANLFGVVGAFFTRLAADAARGAPLAAEPGLENIIQAAINAHPPLSLIPPAKPLMTILVQADGSLAHLYECLVALERAGANEMAEIVVLDHGLFEDVVLITTIVRGVRYVRRGTDLTREWIEAFLQDRAEIMVLLSGDAVVATSFLRSLAFRFEFDLFAGAVGGYVLDLVDDPIHGGLLLSDGDLRSEFDKGSLIADTVVHPVHALTGNIAAFRRDALRSINGIDASFGDDLDHAVIDVCFRLRKSGWSVLVDPLVCMTWRAPSGHHGLASSNTQYEAGRRIVGERWLRPARPTPPLYIGKAIVVGTSLDVTGLITPLCLLRRAGYDVCVHVDEDDPSDPSTIELRRFGARIVANLGAGAFAADLLFAVDAGGAASAYGAAQGVIVGLDALVERLDQDPRPAERSFEARIARASE